MPTPHDPLNLESLPLAVLKAISDRLNMDYAPAIVNDPIKLSTEEGRYQLAYDAGKREVADRFARALKLATERQV